MLKSPRHIGRTRDISFMEQIHLLDQIASGFLNIEFDSSNNYPSSEKMYSLISDLEVKIAKSNFKSITENELLIELQLSILLSLIMGISPRQFFAWNYGDWILCTRKKYIDKKLNIIAKNEYANYLIIKLKLIRKSDLRINSQALFQRLKIETFVTCLNLLLVFYGIETSLSLKRIEFLFGRMLYQKHGQIKDVREFLKDYYNVDSHIELLVDLKLIESLRYNTMMRN